MFGRRMKKNKPFVSAKPEFKHGWLRRFLYGRFGSSEHIALQFGRYAVMELELPKPDMETVKKAESLLSRRIGELGAALSAAEAARAKAGAPQSATNAKIASEMEKHREQLRSQIAKMSGFSEEIRRLKAARGLE